jgi:hypothetical protein
MTTALEAGEGLASRPGRSLPPGKTRYQLYRRLDGPQNRSGQVRKILPPPGFDPRTVQPVVAIPTELPGPHMMFCRPVILSCITGTIQVTDGQKYIPGGSHAGQLCSKVKLKSDDDKASSCFTTF